MRAARHVGTTRLAIGCGLWLAMATPVLAQSAPATSDEATAVPSGDEDGPLESEDDDAYTSDDDDLVAADVLVVGERLPDPDSTPQASTTYDEADLRRQQPLSVVDVVRRAPGVTVRDEEGIGLRPNIGFRGLYSDRSRNVLVMEDGVPIAMMPYDYPELYVAPAVERYRSVELVHGAAMLLYGPRTIGAVLNFVTLAPPAELTLIGDARIGTDGYGYGFASAGDTIGDLGVLVTAMYQHFDGPRHLDLNRLDTMARFAIDLHDAGELRLKLQFYDEDSTSTNVGLTQIQFDNGVLDNFAQHDRFPIRRGAAQITHQVELSADTTLSTTAYFSLTTRDWWRQDFNRGFVRGAPVERIVNGAGVTVAPYDDPSMPTAPSDGSAVYFLRTNVGRLREYLVTGLEPRVTGHYDVGWMRGEITGGLRVHYERGRDTDLLGASPDARSGTTLNAQVRDVFAVAGYLRPTFEFFDHHLEIAPGLRVETMITSATQTVQLQPGGVGPDGSYVPQSGLVLTTPALSAGSSVAPLPGVSGVVRLTNDDELSVFGGVHRGYVPPGVRDSILGTGRDVQLAAEYSWNYEIGARGTVGSWLDYETSAFAIDYETAVLMPTEASTTAQGGLSTAGRQNMYGVEARLELDPIAAAGLDWHLPLTVSYTYASAHFGSGYVRDAAGRTLSGNVIPYVPEHTVSARIDFAHPIGIEAQASIDYMSSQFADASNTVESTLDGVTGVIPARAVVNGRLAYTYADWGLTFYVDVRNLLDTHYVSSRAPAGINPGMTRQIFGGIRIQY
ncbi:MAG: TonB-dependent receptor [Sandaracinus sp.]